MLTKPPFLKGTISVTLSPNVAREGGVRRTLAALVVMLGGVGSAVAQNTGSLPDLQGRWIGTSEAVVLGNTNHHPGDPAKPRASSAEITLTIEKQDGQRFWGKAVSRHSEEPIIGVIGYDGRTILWQSSDGASRGTLVGADTIEILYSHATQSGLVAVANRYVRQK
jgi:hypothetical protein